MAGSSDAGLPLAEAFRQFTVAPLTNWANAFSPVFNPVFNPQVVISENSNDVDVENHVLGQAGSYGKQLGIIIDALGVLIAHTLDRSPSTSGEQSTPRERLTSTENRALDDFRKLARQVDQAVAEYRGTPRKGIGKAEIDSVIEGLHSLRHTDRDAYGPLFEQLRAFVNEQAGQQAGGATPHPESAASTRVPRS
jgi:hypothetical protein